MEKRNSLFRYMGILATAVLFFALYSVPPAAGKKEIETTLKRADVLNIDAMKSFGKLERPRVLFLHDLHTDSLEKKGKKYRDCTTCHISENNTLSVKFKRLKDSDKQTVTDIYHTNCIECHKEISRTGEKSGPVECGNCHIENPGTISSGLPPDFDKSLHFQHEKTLEKKCELCHHEYNEKTKKLFYAKEKEGSCRYCHKEQLEENRSSMRQASHFACVNCHLKRMADDKKAGPVKCAGCHDEKNQRMIEKIASVPRMERKQPDQVLITADKGKPETADEKKKNWMNPVPFNHIGHEESNQSCRVCHHEELSSCTACHSIEGSEKGEFINLALAMHQQDSEQSCRGCHIKKQRDPNCAGCHAFIRKGKFSEASCAICHVDSVSMNTGAGGVKKEEVKRLLNSRQIIDKLYGDEDIPEKLIIGGLSDKYEPVEFPHRKIVKTLFKNIKGSKLAGSFHMDRGTLCQGCHHNSPVTKKPSTCTSCHLKPFNRNDMMKPGILGAYHRQCMGCHAEMKLEKPAGCTGCHEEKKK